MRDELVVEPMAERVRSVYHSIHARLWRSIFGFSGSADVADEAVAEAFAQALRRGDEIRDVEAWVWRAAFAVARGELARRQTHDLPLPEGAVELGEPAFDLVAALAKLSDADRELLVLCHVAGYSPTELAHLLGLRASAVRVRLLRARRRAQPLLEGLR